MPCAGNDSFVLTGLPGLGKTVWIIYCIAKLFQSENIKSVFLQQRGANVTHEITRSATQPMAIHGLFFLFCWYDTYHAVQEVIQSKGTLQFLCILNTSSLHKLNLQCEFSEVCTLIAYEPPTPEQFQLKGDSWTLTLGSDLASVHCVWLVQWSELQFPGNPIACWPQLMSISHRVGVITHEMKAENIPALRRPEAAWETVLFYDAMEPQFVGIKAPIILVTSPKSSITQVMAFPH